MQQSTVPTEDWTAMVEVNKASSYHGENRLRTDEDMVSQALGD